MPELPEVETVARELNRVLKGQKILSVESFWPGLFSRSPGGLARAKRNLIGRVIQKVARRGKRIFIYLSGDTLLAVHLKMTGTFLWDQKTKNDRFIRAKFFLTRGTLYFSDIRKFGRMIVGSKAELLRHKDIAAIAPDPFQISVEAFAPALNRRSIPIKQALLNQEVISGIGNIYADEILWAAEISPFISARLIKNINVKNIITHAKRIMLASIAHGGTSMRDFKNTKGERGGYFALCNVYGREGGACRRNCGGIIKRVVIGTRSARFCPKCQPTGRTP